MQGAHRTQGIGEKLQGRYARAAAAGSIGRSGRGMGHSGRGGIRAGYRLGGGAQRQATPAPGGDTMRMQFDLATAMIMNSVLTLGVGLSLAVTVSRYPDQLRRAMHVWIGGLLLQIPVFLMFGLNGALPGSAAIVLANALFALAYAEMARAVRVFAGGNARNSRTELILIAALIAVPIVFGYLIPSPRWRLGLGAPLLAFLSLGVARAILARGGTLRAADYLTGGLFIACAIPMLARACIELSGLGESLETARTIARNLFFLTGSSLPMIGTIGFLLMCNDRINEELSRLAMLDPLTGVFNRRTFETHAQNAIAHAQRNGLALSLLAVDIDHFKRVNDEFGHEGGDLALQRIVELLQQNLSEAEILSRIGGEEFAVLIPGADEAAASTTAERLRRHLERSTVNVDGRELTLHISAGVATLAPGTANLSALLRAADRALYAAKRAGRNRIATSSALAEAVA
jgi:diguanylate cyclase (GGDEF)-like protein